GRGRAARRRGALLHAVAHTAAGAGLAGELPSLARRRARAGAGRALPAPRSPLAALAALRSGGRQDPAGADRRRRRADAVDPSGRAATRRPRLSGPARRRQRRRRGVPGPRGRDDGPGARRAHHAVLRHLTMLLDVEHRFTFEYDAYISESFMELRLQPKTTGDQTVNSFELAVGPPTRVHRYQGWNDNVTHHFTIPSFH